MPPNCSFVVEDAKDTWISDQRPDVVHVRHHDKVHNVLSYCLNYLSVLAYARYPTRSQSGNVSGAPTAQRPTPTHVILSALQRLS